MAIASKLPYLNAYGNLTKALEKIKTAATPGRFSQDYLEKTLAMKGGSSRPILPFLKRTGFLASDGSPTNLYKQFRNPDLSGAAAAEALRIGYAPLYEMDEEVHKRDATKLKNLVVQATGSDADAPSVRCIVKSFEALKAFGDFGAQPIEEDADTENDDAEDQEDTDEQEDDSEELPPLKSGINLGYTINLHLPSTSDVGVYNAIFRSLRENLLRDLN